MTEFAVEMEVVVSPNHGEGAVFEHFRVPHAFEPLIFAGSQTTEPLLMRGDGGGSVGAHGNQRGLRREQGPGGLGIVTGHGVE